MEKYVDGSTKTIFNIKHDKVCNPCDQNEKSKTLTNTPGKPAIKTDNAYLASTLLSNNISKIKSENTCLLNRTDIGGYGGMSNGRFDAWYIGFSPDIITGVWVGFDKTSDIGLKETATTTAFPAWQSFMNLALKEKPVQPVDRPENIVDEKINIKTDLILTGCKSAGTKTRSEVFTAKNIPKKSPRCK